MSQDSMKDQILTIAREILSSDGLAAVSFDAIARRLDRTKQADLYWYPTKHDLLAAMFLPWLQAETDTAIAAVSGATTRDKAISAFIIAVTHFHSENLDRFRMMYLLPQTIRPGVDGPQRGALLEQIHPVTDRMYAALAERLGTDRATVRQEAFAIHSAVLGLALMLGLADSIKDPLKHDTSELVNALISTLQAK